MAYERNLPWLKPTPKQSQPRYTDEEATRIDELLRQQHSHLFNQDGSLKEISTRSMVQTSRDAIVPLNNNNNSSKRQRIR